MPRQVEGPHGASDVLADARHHNLRVLLRGWLGVLVAICGLRVITEVAAPSTRGLLDLALHLGAAALIAAGVSLSRRGQLARATTLLLGVLAGDALMSVLRLEVELRVVPAFVLAFVAITAGVVESPARARRWGLGLAIAWCPVAAGRAALDGATIGQAASFVIAPALAVAVTTWCVDAITRALEDARARARRVSLADMSHDLRTPLNAILGYSRRLARDARRNGLDTAAVDHITIASGHLLATLNDLLDVSALEAGRAQLRVETFTLTPLLARVAATVTPLLTRHHNELRLDIDGARGRVVGDPVKLQQCLVPLLRSAAALTRRGTITLRAWRGEERGREWLHFEVHNTGLGIDAELLASVLDAGAPAGERVTRHGGFGLGLALSRQLCELMGGELRARSTPGAGTTFSLRLPAVGPASAARAASRLEGDEGAMSPPTVLLIDKHPARRERVRGFLADAGYRPRTAASGRDGLTAARRHRPDLVVLDVHLPDIDGWSVLGDLKGDAALASIPVILLASEGELDHALAMGAAEVITRADEREHVLGVLARHAHRGGSDILIVEDDHANRELLGDMLDDIHWPHREAANGREALELVARKIPRLIILDLTMPEMDGFTFLERLRERSPWTKIPVVVVTAKELTTAERRFLRGRAVSIQRKGSITPEDLLSELDRLVGDAGAPASETGARVPIAI